MVRNREMNWYIWKVNLELIVIDILLTNELINVMSDVEGDRDLLAYCHQHIPLLASYGLVLTFTFKVLSTINGWLTVNSKNSRSLMAILL